MDARVPRLDRSIFHSTTGDYAFVIAPFWIGAAYLAAVTAFPASRTVVFFVFLMLLGETHFGATWLFFFTRENWGWIRDRAWKVIYAPIILTVAYAIIGLNNLGLAVLIGGAASGFHVTRQSIGVYRLFGGKHNDWNECAIYMASFGFIGIGFIRFEFDRLPLPSTLLSLVDFLLLPGTLALVAAIGVYLMITFRHAVGLKRWFAVLTGCAIYMPYTFVSVPQDAIAIGVGMHWCQYLAINYAVYHRRAESASAMRKNLSENAAIVVLIGLYALVMASFGTAFGTSLRSDSLLILIPLCGQFAHYYVDAFIWRFSDPHIRKEVGAYLTAR